MRIGIIGASSQVGSSLAFYFKKYPNVEPVCFIRSGYSAVFFEIAAIEYTIVDADKWTKEHFTGLDAVIDCTYPSGQLYEIGKQVKQQFRSVFPLLPAGISFIYMSTIMAFGMPDGYKKVKNFLIPRSTYAYLKRKAEKLVNGLSVKYKMDGYNFRLGQVHGFLQSVNSSYREKLSMNNDVILDGEPGDLVNIIFISTLAEAIIKAARKEIPPATYSLVNEPQWTLVQLYEYYEQYYSLHNKIIFSEAGKTIGPKEHNRSLMGYLKNCRPLIETFFLIRSKQWYIKVKGKYRVMNVNRSISNSAGNVYTDFHLLGKNPGTLITNLTCDMKLVMEKEKSMESDYNNCIEKNMKRNN